MSKCVLALEQPLDVSPSNTPDEQDGNLNRPRTIAGAFVDRLREDLTKTHYILQLVLYKARKPSPSS